MLVAEPADVGAARIGMKALGLARIVWLPVGSGRFPARRLAGVNQVFGLVIVVIDDAPHGQDLVRRLAQDMERRMLVGAAVLQQLLGVGIATVGLPAQWPVRLVVR